MTKRIVATYYLISTFDIDELGIDMNDVKEWFIKYDKLYINWKDDTRAQSEYEPTDSNVDDHDLKHPDDEELDDDDE